MRVLFVDHTSLISGAQGALLDLLETLPAEVEPTMMCPPGPLAEAVRSLGIDVVEYSGTRGSLRLHPVRTPKALWEIARSALAIRRTCGAIGADVVHANSFRAGMMAGLVRPLGKRPTVLHVHDAFPDTRAAHAIRGFLQRTADAVITISDYTTANFAAGRASLPVHTLHNPLDLERFDPASYTQAEARQALGLARDVPLIGLVAQITPWKGQELAIRVLAALTDRHSSARLLLVGETKFVDVATRYDNVAYLESLRRLASDLGLEERVDFLGERADVPQIVRALDVLVAPSWEEPFGRSVIEAMALETPVLATSVGGPAEYIDDGVDGRLLPPRDVAAWATAIDELLADEGLRRAMGRSASRKVRSRFDRREFAEKVVDVYRKVSVERSANDRACGPSRSATKA